MHRVFLSPAGSIEALERIADEYRHYATAGSCSSEPRPFSVSQRTDATHPARLELRHGIGKVVRRVQGYELLRALHNCRQEKLPIRISIGTAGCMQTHTGVLREIQGSPYWTRAIGVDTIAYIRDADIAETHIVEATAGEMRSMSLCAFDAQGRSVVALGVLGTERQRFSYQWNLWLEGLSDI